MKRTPAASALTLVRDDRDPATPKLAAHDDATRAVLVKFGWRRGVPLADLAKLLTRAAVLKLPVTIRTDLGPMK